MEVASYLKAWLALQPPLTRDTVQMHHFMETPYSVLAQEFEQSRGYALEAAFLNSRFAEYFAWTGNLGPRGLQLLVLAADGLESQLGHTHRKTLAARDALATGRLEACAPSGSSGTYLLRGTNTSRGSGSRISQGSRKTTPRNSPGESSNLRLRPPRCIYEYEL